MPSLQDTSSTLLEWVQSNKRLALVEMLIKEAKLLRRTEEADEEAISDYSRTAKGMAERDMLWRLYFNAKDQLHHHLLTNILK